MNSNHRAAAGRPAKAERRRGSASCRPGGFSASVLPGGFASAGCASVRPGGISASGCASVLPGGFAAAGCASCLPGGFTASCLPGGFTASCRPGGISASGCASVRPGGFTASGCASVVRAGSPRPVARRRGRAVRRRRVRAVPPRPVARRVRAGSPRKVRRVVRADPPRPAARRRGPAGEKKAARLACKGVRLVVVLRAVEVGFQVGGLHRLPVRRGARGRRVFTEAGSSRRGVRRVVSFSNTARLSWKPESVSRPAMATGSLSGGPNACFCSGREAT